MKRIDRDALTRALAAARADPERRQQIEHKLADGDPWIEVAQFAAYVMQCKTMRLKPWMAPPCHVYDPVTGTCGGTPQESALCERMQALGLSLYEPDPIGAIAAAEVEHTTGHA